MSKTADGKYIYSMDNCCCLEEKREAFLHFPPDEYGRRKGGVAWRG